MSPTPVTQPNMETPTWGRCLRKSWATARKWPHATILTPPWVPEEVGMYSRQASPPFNVGRRGATSTTLAPWWAMVRLPPTAKSTTEAAVNISSLRKLTWRPMRWPRTFKEYLQLCNSFMLPCDKYSTRHYVLPLLPPIQQYSGFFNAMQVFCLMSEREKKIQLRFSRPKTTARLFWCSSLSFFFSLAAEIPKEQFSSCVKSRKVQVIHLETSWQFWDRHCPRMLKFR